jgi:hypothetical protein
MKAIGACQCATCWTPFVCSSHLMLYSFLQYGYTWNRKAEERVTAALLAAEDILDEDADMEEG